MFKIPERHFYFGQVERVWFVNYWGGGSDIHVVFLEGRGGYCMSINLTMIKKNHLTENSSGDGVGVISICERKISSGSRAGNEGFVEIHNLLKKYSSI